MERRAVGSMNPRRMRRGELPTSSRTRRPILRVGGRGGGGHVSVLMYSDPDPTFDGFEFWIQTFEKIKQNLIFVC